MRCSLTDRYSEIFRHGGAEWQGGDLLGSSGVLDAGGLCRARSFLVVGDFESVRYDPQSVWPRPRMMCNIAIGQTVEIYARVLLAFDSRHL